MSNKSDQRPGTHNAIPYSFTAIPTDFLCDSAIPLDLVGFLAKLVTYARPHEGRYEIWPKVSTIAAHMGKSKVVVSRLLAKCEKLGLLARQRRLGRSSTTYLSFLGKYEPNGFSPVISDRTEDVGNDTTVVSPGVVNEEDNHKKKKTQTTLYLKNSTEEENKEEEQTTAGGSRPSREDTPPPSKEKVLNTKTKSYERASGLAQRWTALQATVPNLVDAPEITKANVGKISWAVVQSYKLKTQPLVPENWGEMAKALASEASWRGSVSFEELYREGGANAERIMLRYQAKQRKVDTGPRSHKDRILYG